jgi:hypothetical protein
LCQRRDGETGKEVKISSEKRIKNCRKMGSDKKELGKMMMK